MKGSLSALAAGIIFGVGLCLSGMTDPRNVLAFLDFSGHWSPNLAGVMLGAIAVHASWLRWGARRGRISSAGSAQAPVDAALVGGAALFGVGWGLAGYCPGPALVALGSGALGPLVFVGAMVLGIQTIDVLRRSGSAALGDSSDGHTPSAAESS